MNKSKLLSRCWWGRGHISYEAVSVRQDCSGKGFDRLSLGWSRQGHGEYQSKEISVLEKTSAYVQQMVKFLNGDQHSRVAFRTLSTILGQKGKRCTLPKNNAFEKYLLRTERVFFFAAKRVAAFYCFNVGQHFFALKILMGKGSRCNFLAIFPPSE